MYIDVYTDGSYLKTNPKVVTGGIAILLRDESGFRDIKSIRRVVCKLPVLVDAQSFGGEAIAVVTALADCKNYFEDGKNTIVVHHDNECVAKFINGTYNASKPSAVWYRDAVNMWIEINPNVELKFIYVKAHGNNKFNNLVDSIASGAIPSQYLEYLQPTVEL